MFIYTQLTYKVAIIFMRVLLCLEGTLLRDKRAYEIRV